MKKNATFRHWFNARPRIVPVAALALGALLLVAFCGTATAAPIGKDGVIHACYRVKGKPKGSVRVLVNAKAHCRRGERKVAWSAVPTGANGQSGQGGQSGQSGQGGAAGGHGDAGSAGAPGSKEAELEAKVASLSLQVDGLEGLLSGIGKGDLNGLVGKVDGLEGLLGGVTDGDLSGVLGRVGGLEDVLQGIDPGDLTDVVSDVGNLEGLLDGVAPGDLTETIGALPLLGDVCAQTEELTGRSNALLNFLNTLDTLNLLSLPLELPTFNVCPTP